MSHHVPEGPSFEGNVSATMRGNMENLAKLVDPVRRRQQLLLKALETKPLDEALALVKAVEAFLTAPTPPPSAPVH